LELSKGYQELVAALGSTSESGDLHDLKLVQGRRDSNFVREVSKETRYRITLHGDRIMWSNGRFHELYVPYAIVEYSTAR